MLFRFKYFFFLTVFLISFFSFLFFTGCAGDSDFDSIVLPQDSAIHEADVYAVVVKPYVTLKDCPGDSGISIGHVRKNEVCNVKSKVFVSVHSKSELWVELDEGWLEASCVELYASKEKALTASQCLGTAD